MPHPFAAFYRGKRALVTGHTGFTGGWLVAWLKLLGAKVCGYGLPPSSRPNFFDATLLDRGINSVFADVRDRDTLANTFADFQPEIIFHGVAAHSASNQVEVFDVNVMGTLHVLEEVRLTTSARAVVLLGSSESASQTRDLPGKHSQATANWLRATHATAELSALAFADSFFRESRTGIAIAQLPALLGGGDWNESRFIPDLVRSLISGEPMVIRNASGPPYAHTLEAARACLDLAQSLYASGPAISGAWDFSPADHEAISEEDLAKRFVDHWGGEGVQRESHQLAAGPIGPSKPSQAKLYPGWTCALSLDEAIAWAIDWYKDYSADPASAWRTTEAQIEQYAKLPLSQTAIPAATPSLP
jgi:CDP-glucose 4,6-dehydratase